MDWPWKRFERFYQAFMRRQLIENLERRKDMMIAALWSNSGFEGNEGGQARNRAIADIESNYEEAVYAILSGVKPGEAEEEVDEQNPFWQAAKKGQEEIQAPINGDGTVREAVESEYEIDQD
jgi:hypothetical protein